MVLELDGHRVSLRNTVPAMYRINSPTVYFDQRKLTGRCGPQFIAPGFKLEADERHKQIRMGCFFLPLGCLKAPPSPLAVAGINLLRNQPAPRSNGPEGFRPDIWSRESEPLG